MTSRIGWEDLVWVTQTGEDNSSSVTIPTLSTHKFQPNGGHGLGYESEVVELCKRKKELFSGVNLAHGLVSGGTMGIFSKSLLKLKI